MDALFLILLLLTSIVGVTFIVERGLALRWQKVIPPEVEAAVNAFRNANDLGMLKEICLKNSSPLSRLLLTAIDHRDWPKAESVDTLQTQARHEIMKLERGMVILEIVVGIAPLLGLVGTIYGLILLFGGLGPSGMNDNSQVASGIALALRATLLGLLTAIPALIAWSYYNKKVESISVELETLCDQFMRRFYRQPAAEIPVKTEKTETKPVHAKPTEVKPVETKPAEPKPVQAKPTETKPVEVKAAEVKLVETKMPETKPLETKVEPKPEVKAEPKVEALPNTVKVEAAPKAEKPHKADKHDKGHKQAKAEPVVEKKV